MKKKTQPAAFIIQISEILGRFSILPKGNFLFRRLLPSSSSIIRFKMQKMTFYFLCEQNDFCGRKTTTGNTLFRCVKPSRNLGGHFKCSFEKESFECGFNSEAIEMNVEKKISTAQFFLQFLDLEKIFLEFLNFQDLPTWIQFSLFPYEKRRRKKYIQSIQLFNYSNLKYFLFRITK